MGHFYKKTPEGNVSVGVWRVVFPRAIKRIGYPFDARLRASELLDAERYLDGYLYRLLPKEHRGPVATMLECCLGKEPTYKAVRKVCDSLAYAEGEACGWGGNERGVELLPPLDSLRGHIVRPGRPVKVHRVGRRVFDGYEEGTHFEMTGTVVAVNLWGDVWIPFSHLERLGGE